MFSVIFCFDWFQICKNFNLRITESMAQNPVTLTQTGTSTVRNFIGFWAKSAQGRIQDRAIIGQLGALLQRTSSSELEGYSNKPNVI